MLEAWILLSGSAQKVTQQGGSFVLKAKEWWLEELLQRVEYYLGPS
jgi:hypothetical protein